VTDGPLFTHPLAVQQGAIHEEAGFLLVDMEYVAGGTEPS
jgi:hypothetical protein